MPLLLSKLPPFEVSYRYGTYVFVQESGMEYVCARLGCSAYNGQESIDGNLVFKECRRFWDRSNNTGISDCSSLEVPLRPLSSKSSSLKVYSLSIYLDKGVGQET